MLHFKQTLGISDHKYFSHKTFSMKPKIFILSIIATLLVALSNIHCSKSGGSSGDFIPIIENQWHNKDVADDFFDIGPAAQPGINSSTFTGTEDSASGAGSYSFSGSFTNHNIQFTYDNSSGAKSNQTFSGTINDASTVMTLHNNVFGDLVIEK
jgi:hypothetical protein